ncbi:uncharacterized protein LOC142608673 [Castanea sativa]|uniref:uncharacterized protein LOC142608673 n=1 Tax=Castanea sativa TaxID=21020 RepID=UPI003F64D1FD
MSTFLLPRKINDKSDAAVRRFWWKPKEDSNKFFTPMAGDDLCRLKDEDGLAKYKVRANWLRAPKAFNASWVWKGIERVKNIIKLGVCKLVGSGNSILVLEDPWLPDKSSFFPTPRSQFSVKSCYRLITDGDNISSSVSLSRKIWKANIHERLKMHLWRIAFNLLPTKDQLSEFSPSSDTSCPLYNVEAESALHLFTQCHIARVIWFGNQWNLRIDRWHVQSLTQLIEFFIDPSSLELDKEQRDEFLIFGALTLDMIWRWRNKVVNERSLPLEGQVIRSLQKLFLEHWWPKVPVLTRVPTRSSARWCCPNQGMLKLNCDAAVGDLSSCIAIVTRDWRGKLVFAVYKKVDTNIPVQAEANAILVGDGKVCIDAIKVGENLIPWRFLNFVDSITNVISDYSHVSFNWVHREANQAVNVLAN